MAVPFPGTALQRPAAEGGAAPTVRSKRGREDNDDEGEFIESLTMAFTNKLYTDDLVLPPKRLDY